MNFKNAFIDYLYDMNYFIALYDKNIQIFRYNNILKIKDEEIKIEFNNFILFIKGSKLLIKKMTKEELLIEGNITSIIKNNDNNTN